MALPPIERSTLFWPRISSPTRYSSKISPSAMPRPLQIFLRTQIIARYVRSVNLAWGTAPMEVTIDIIFLTGATRDIGQLPPEMPGTYLILLLYRLPDLRSLNLRCRAENHPIIDGFLGQFAFSSIRCFSCRSWILPRHSLSWYFCMANCRFLPLIVFRNNAYIYKYLNQ